MRKRSARVICGAMAWIVLAAAAVFVFRAERDVESLRTAQRIFDQQTRETIDAIAELRAAQQAYVVGGQGVAFWVAKVVTTGDTVRANIETLRNSSTVMMTRAALDNALKALSQFTSADKRALEYINASQPLMAGDVIFTEGGQAAAGTSQHVEAARLAERQEVDAREGTIRRQETMTLVTCAALVAVIVFLLVPASEPKPFDEPRPLPMPHAEARTQPYTWSENSDAVEYARRAQVPANGNGTPAIAPAIVPALPPESVAASADSDVTIDGWRLNLGDFDDSGFNIPVPPRRNDPSDPIRLTLDAMPEPISVIMPASPGFLKAAADLATDFGRIHDFGDLKQLIARAALLTEASGVVVWVGNAQGGDLRPVLTHGYSAPVVSRLAPVSRSANNAAAAAYRTGTLQVVPSQPFSSGAIVAPILTPDGCIGALSAEFRGAEASEPVQAFAAIVASHLAGVLSTAPSGAAEARMAG